LPSDLEEHIHTARLPKGGEGYEDGFGFGNLVAWQINISYIHEETKHVQIISAKRHKTEIAKDGTASNQHGRSTRSFDACEAAKGCRDS